MCRQNSDISAYHWTLALIKLIETAYRLHSSGKEVKIRDIRNFLNIARLPLRIQSKCRAYLGELSIDLKQWKLVGLLGHWDRKSKAIFINFINERVQDDGFMNVKDGRLVPELIENPDAEDILFVPSWKQSPHVHTRMKHNYFAVRSAIILLIPLSEKRVGFIFIGIPFNLSKVLKGISNIREYIAKNHSIEPIVLPQWYIHHIHEKLYHDLKWMNKKFRSFDSCGSGGLDVGSHSLRVAHVGNLLAHKIGFSLADRLRLFTASLLHDSGKRELNHDILTKLACREWDNLDPTEKSKLKRHSQYSAAHFLVLFSNQIQREWMFPILCHHAPKREFKITHIAVQNCLEDLGYEDRYVYKQAKEKLQNCVIVEAMDILRVADCIEDKAVERFHRYQPRDINCNLGLILNGRDKKRFPEHIVDVLRDTSSDIIDLYENIRWNFPKNAEALGALLVNPQI